MNTVNLLRAAIAGLAMFASSAANAGSKFDEVNLVKEGIDPAYAIVRANPGGYTTYETATHSFIVRLFAKAKGANRVFAGAIGSKPYMDFIEVTGGKWFFKQETPGDGWGVYKRSLVFSAKLSEMPWYVSPKQACNNNMLIQNANGMKNVHVLAKEWKVAARAIVYFYAGADSVTHIRNDNLLGSETRYDSIAYPVNVICRASN